MPTITYRSSAVAMAVAIAAIHLVIAPTVDLSVDEAHYALYAHFLDWSYFDHPPMVGWLLWLFSPLGLDEFTLRLPPAFIYLLCTGLIYRITANRLDGGDARKGFLAVLVFSLTPIVQLLGFGLVPEFPLLLWCLGIALVGERLCSQSPLTQWLLLGLLLGLAGLSKYTAVLILPGLLFYWLLHQRLGKILLSPKLYAAAALAALLISPVIGWNYLHDWASFNYQLNHAAGGEWELDELVRALLIQLITYSPLIVIGGMISLRQIRAAGMRGLLVCLALPILLFVCVGAGNGSSLPHWPLVGWSLLIPLVSHWVVDQWRVAWVRRLALFGTGLSFALSSTVLLLVALKPLGAVPWAVEGLRDLVGWREAARYAQRLSKHHFPDDGIILVSNWSRASRIAWYARPQTVQVLDDRPGQFVYWYGAPNENTRGILIRDNIDEDEDPTRTYRKMGLNCSYLEQTVNTIDEVPVNRFYFYLCTAATD